METKNQTKVCEYVSSGHPDKVADQISDALLDEYLKEDTHTRAGIEVMVKDNIVVLGGEVNTTAEINAEAVVRRVFSDLHYPANHHLSSNEIKVINLIGRQSPEISQSVDKSDGTVGAGDQGFMVGFASNETDEYMPLGVYLAKHLCEQVTEIEDLGPDCKTQVTIDYADDKPQIRSILVSTMHQCQLKECRQRVTDKVKQWLKENDYSVDIDIIVNPSGDWHIGGSVSDCGMTGRKIVVDHYGSYAPIGGGNLHGKCMSKVDRSGSYMARYLAKNIVAAGLADTAKVELAYMIGCPKPSSVNIELNRNASIVPQLLSWIEKHIDLSVSGIIKRFDGGLPRYYTIARKGHFGISEREMLRNEQLAVIYPWEKTDIAEQMKNEITLGE